MTESNGAQQGARGGQECVQNHITSIDLVGPGQFTTQFGRGEEQASQVPGGQEGDTGQPNQSADEVLNGFPNDHPDGCFVALSKQINYRCADEGRDGIAKQVRLELHPLSISKDLNTENPLEVHMYFTVDIYTKPVDF